MTISKQEYYDLLFEAAYDGTFPSYDAEHGRCRYRKIDNDGKEHRCAAGVLLLPEDYVVEASYSNSDNNKKLFEKRLPEGMTLTELQQCQDTHDSCCFGGWESENFITRINRLGCFKDVNRRDPR